MWCHEIGSRRYPGLFGEIAPPQGVSRSRSAKLMITNNGSYAIVFALSQQSEIAEDIEDFLVPIKGTEMATSFVASL